MSSENQELSNFVDRQRWGSVASIADTLRGQVGDLTWAGERVGARQSYLLCALEVSEEYDDEGMTVIALAEAAKTFCDDASIDRDWSPGFYDWTREGVRQSLVQLERRGFVYRLPGSKPLRWRLRRALDGSKPVASRSQEAQNRA